MSEEKFKEMATAAKVAIEDFNDFSDDRAISWAYDEICRLQAVIREIATTKIAYCDGYLVAYQFKKMAQELLEEHKNENE